jgi:hydroxymethylbilane synthase
MRVRIVSRASDLAVLQAELVARALRTRWPSLEVVRLTRSSEGDRDQRAALWSMPDKGLFTADLSRALVNDDADLAVHSWKDLPIRPPAGTVVAGTLPRADPRDVLLFQRDVATRKPSTLTILSSSPRRSWQLETSLRPRLPWPVAHLTLAPVRGNIPTRLRRLLAGDGDALVVAKAALDRLLSEDAPAAVATDIRAALGRCRWMVLPLKEHPAAPAQGAIGIEVAESRPDLLALAREISDGATWAAVTRERAILEALGGGCHEAVGATVLVRDYGEVTSVRARMPGLPDQLTWSLTTTTSPPPSASAGTLWPRPDERDRARRRPLEARPPSDSAALWVARAEALPEAWPIGEDQLVWAAGGRTWERLSARGVWVNGCADGLGDQETPDVDRLAGRRVEWQRVTHAASGDPQAIATYVVDQDVPADLDRRTHFFWTSGSLFLEALRRVPAIRRGWHASGPGRTARVVRDALGSDSDTHFSIWLDYDQWHQALTR